MSKPSDYIRKGWCRHQHAMRSDLRPCAVDSPQAKAWDIVGAILAADPTPSGTVDSLLIEINNRRREQLEVAQADPRTKLDTLRRLKKNVSDLPTWNDDPARTQDEVIDVLDTVGL